MEANTQYRPVSRGRAGLKLALFVGGAVVGYAAATLLSPKSGREVRSSIGEYAKSTTDSVSGAVRNAVGAAREATRTVTRRMADALDHGKEEARYATESAAAKVASAAKTVEDTARERATPGHH
ncbi:MAG: YtxH domain-containing protein [Acidiferrobacter sp.]